MGEIFVKGIGRVRIQGDTPTPEESEVIARGQGVGPTPDVPTPIDGPFSGVDRAIRALLPPDEYTGRPVQERATGTFGFKDYETRGTILPFGKTREGKFEFATPQIGVDLLTSALLPSHAIRGGEYAPEDVTKFALDFAAPAGRSIGGGVRRGLSKREFIDAAPSTEELKTAAIAKKTAATASGMNVDPDRFSDLLATMEKEAVRNRLNPTLHPKTTGVFQVLAKELGNSPDVEDLHILRRIINDAEKNIGSDDARQAGILREALDDFVLNMTDADTVAGGSEDVAKNLKAFRQNWARAMKSDAIERIVELAQTQASGFENGIRIQIRQLLRNPKRLRGFSDAEIEMMKHIESGGSIGDKLLRLGAKAGFGKPGGGSNFLGGAIATGAGQAAAGPVGAVTVPAVGGMMGEASASSIASQTDLLRAMVATSQGAPKYVRLKALADVLTRGAGPAVGAQMPTTYQGKPVI